MDIQQNEKLSSWKKIGRGRGLDRERSKRMGRENNHNMYEIVKELT